MKFLFSGSGVRAQKLAFHILRHIWSVIYREVVLEGMNTLTLKLGFEGKTILK